jgi:hypothetical protein
MDKAFAYMVPTDPRDYAVYKNEFVYGWEQIENWNPQVVIEFISWIDRSTAEIFTQWCLDNCKSGFIQPKVWWIEFELESDFQKFKEHFDLRIPTESPRLPDGFQIEKEGIIIVDGSKCQDKVTKYEQDFFWSNINDWCHENCVGEWFTAPYDPFKPNKIVRWYITYYCFVNLDDAMKFKLVWV